MEYTTITLPIPIGGLNTRDEPTIMNRLTSPSLHNVEIDKSIIRKRQGYSQLGSNLPLTGTGKELLEYTDGQGTVHLIALTTNNAYVFNSSTNEWDEITPTAADFTGTVIDRWSWTLASNLDEFPNNGGTALVIGNKVDGLFAYEGHTGDKFKALAISTGLTGFVGAKEVVDFWNSLCVCNYICGAVTFIRNIAWHDITVDTYANLNITENILTDSKGEIKRAKKLNYDMVLYSASSITLCRYVGGNTVFVFPTVLYETGLYAEKAIWDHLNIHYFLGSNHKIYAYDGTSYPTPIGQMVEDKLFDDMDYSQSSYIVTGMHIPKHKIYFFYPTAGTTYSRKFISYNLNNETPSWESGELFDAVADISIYKNQVTLACNSTSLAGKACSDAEFSVMPCSSGNTLSGYPLSVFLSRDGYVYKFSSGSSSDDGENIEAWMSTPDLVPTDGRTDEEARHGGYNFSARADVSGSTLDIQYSTDGGINWITMTTITLTNTWTQYRNPLDIKCKKIRYRLYQNSTGDFQVRSHSYKIQLATDK